MFLAPARRGKDEHCLESLSPRAAADGRIIHETNDRGIAGFTGLSSGFGHFGFGELREWGRIVPPKGVRLRSKTWGV